MRKKLVLKTHVKRRVCRRRKCLSSLPGDISRTTVVVTKGIFDLSMESQSQSQSQSQS